MISRQPNCRSSTARRGSILILVVALLVLIALIATAMLSTTRNDRYASKQHEANVQIDLLVEGAKQIAIGKIIDDLLGTVGGSPLYRPGEVAESDNSYDPYDTTQPIYPLNGNYGTKNDAWLMPRVPVLQNFSITIPDQPAATAIAADTSNFPIWSSITAPLAANAFESIDVQPWPKQQIPGDLHNGKQWTVPASMRQFGAQLERSDIFPSTISHNGQELPSLKIFDVARGRAFNYLAADTDGDGIADAMLQKLPMGPINGVTYYVAYRIIDNNSGINPNTATSVYVDFHNGAALGQQFGNLALFPSNIGLAELLRQFPRGLLNSNAATLGMLNAAGPDAPGDFARLVQYRMGNSGDVVPDGMDLTNVGGKDVPRDDSAGTLNTNTFRYISYADAIWMGLGRRILNPGYANATTRFQGFGVGDAMSMSYPFAIRNANASQSQLETVLKASTYKTAITTAYTGDVTGITNWYNQNFDGFINSGLYATTGYLPIRSILTPFNPTSNQSSNAALTTPYAFTVTFINNASTTFSAATITVGNDGTPKTSINTAGFEELFRGFFSTMAEDFNEGSLATGSPFTKQIAAYNWTTNGTVTFGSDASNDPYFGMKWDNPVSTIFNCDLANQQKGEVHPAGMFRSSLRVAPTTLDTSGSFSNNTYRIPPAEMVKLRAAIAAANAKEARDADYDIDPVDVPISLTQSTDVEVAKTVARIYGLEAQVFITEVFVHTDTITNAGGSGANPRGYIAIEIFNPNEFDVDISQCALLGVDRATVNDNTVPNYTFSSIALSTAISNMSDDNGLPSFNRCVVPSKGYLVLENFDASGAGSNANAAMFRPAASNLPNGTAGPFTTPTALGAVNSNFAFVPDLDTVVYNKELVLARPLKSYFYSGSPQRLTYSSQAGVAMNALDFAPLDSFDFTGLNYQNSPTPPLRASAVAWHYMRANDEAATIGSHGWHFVYPGRYNASNSRGPTGVSEPTRPRQQGTLESFKRGGAGPGWIPGTDKDPWDPATPLADSNAPDSTSHLLPSLGWDLATNNPVAGTNLACAYPNTFPIQLPSTNLTMPAGVVNPATAGRYNYYPFGGFARIGDVMDVPFIGSYRILLDSANVHAYNSHLSCIELNSVTMDAAMAEDTDVRDDPTYNPTTNLYGDLANNETQFREQIGKFCPLYNTGANAAPVDDFTQAFYGDFPTPDSPMNAVGLAKLHYHWAKDLFDYFTVLNPNDDSLPNASSSTYRYNNPSAFGTTPLAISGVSNSGTPASLSNTKPDGSAGVPTNGNAEDTEPVHGLVNINTAPWQVLAMIPWFPGDNNFAAARDQWKLVADTTGTPPDPRLVRFQPGSDGVPDNEQMARAIVMWRDGSLLAKATAGGPNPPSPWPGNGPFRSLYDLYKVPAFRSVQAQILTSDPNKWKGDLTPFFTAGTDNVRLDSEEQYLLLRRVSNLITTRSDTFTVYLAVQGWRINDADPTKSELVTQRKAAIIVDRSRVTPTNPNPTVYNIPTQQ